MKKKLPKDQSREATRQYILELLDEVSRMASAIGDPLLSAEIKVAAEMGRVHKLL